MSAPSLHRESTDTLIHVKLLNSLNDGNTNNPHQCHVIVKDREKTQDPAGIRSQDLLITSQYVLMVLHKKNEWDLHPC